MEHFYVRVLEVPVPVEAAAHLVGGVPGQLGEMPHLKIPRNNQKVFKETVSRDESGSY